MIQKRGDLISLYYNVQLYTRSVTLEDARDTVAQILAQHGAVPMGEEHPDLGQPYRFPFQLPDGLVKQPYLFTSLARRGTLSPEDIDIDLTCKGGIMYPKEYGRDNLRALIALADDIFCGVQAYFAWAGAEEAMSGGLSGFLSSGLPIHDQFVYVSPALMDLVNMDELLKLPVVTTRLRDGGLLVENRALPFIPALDLTPWPNG
jgi:hypothetical protein